MNFLEAHKTLAAFEGGKPLPLVLAMSGTSAPLKFFLNAAAAKCNRSASVRTLPFGTLPQFLLEDAAAGEVEVFLLLPWDFVSELDWRSGVPHSESSLAQALEQAEATRMRLERRPNARYFFLPAPIPPLFSTPVRDAALARQIAALAELLGATVIPAAAFSLAGYLASGCPIAGAWMGEVAAQVVDGLTRPRGDTCKVLVTDLDNTAWHGVVAEDGIEAIHFSPDGVGFRHFLYQTLLRKLRNEGVLLAAVSRNDQEAALAPLRSGQMVLSEADFACVLASYNAKSSQLREIGRRLNLDLGSFVFVDDNPVELAEVSPQLPQVTCLPFPSRDDGLLGLFSRVSELFARSSLTSEDRERTGLYRRRLAGIMPSAFRGADLTAFLASLRMKLTINDRSRGDYDRAVQLLNKTNQFNLNGQRVRTEDISAALRVGARLYTVSAEDRTGSHGEVISCLVMPGGTVDSWAMSCRVFQRRIEYAFFAWLASSPIPPKALRFSVTDRNVPLPQFLQDPAFECGVDGLMRVDVCKFALDHAGDLSLFDVRVA